MTKWCAKLIRDVIAYQLSTIELVEETKLEVSRGGNGKGETIASSYIQRQIPSFCSIFGLDFSLPIPQHKPTLSCTVTASTTILPRSTNPPANPVSVPPASSATSASYRESNHAPTQPIHIQPTSTMLSRSSFITRRALASAPIRSFQTSRVVLAGKEDALRESSPATASSGLQCFLSLYPHPVEAQKERQKDETTTRSRRRLTADTRFPNPQTTRTAPKRPSRPSKTSCASRSRARATGLRNSPATARASYVVPHTLASIEPVAPLQSERKHIYNPTQRPFCLLFVY